MVFKMVTLDLTRDYEDDFYPPPPDSPSPSNTSLCFTATTFAELAASTSSALLTRPCGISSRPNKIENREATEFVHPGNLTVFTFKELQVATNNFSIKSILGRGAFGKVYKGTLANGYAVAVKISKDVSPCRLLQFQAEVKVGKMPNHWNVVPLLGFRIGRKPKHLRQSENINCARTETSYRYSTKPKHQFLLVYPFMVNLSAACCLRERPPPLAPPLGWKKRMRIALGVARGLAHLHSLDIIHRDIKVDNVVLDDRFNPHISDFGLAIFLNERHKPTEHAPSNNASSEMASLNLLSMQATNSETHATTGVSGTIGHIAPEYFSTGRCSKKNDVFGFGVMLLELITGKCAYDLALRANDEDAMLLDWVKGLFKEGRLKMLIDHNVEGGYEESEVELLTTIALLCTRDNPIKRPNMPKVIQYLEDKKVEETWQDLIMDEILFRPLYRIQYHTADDSVSNLIPEVLAGPR